MQFTNVCPSPPPHNRYIVSLAREYKNVAVIWFFLLSFVFSIPSILRSFLAPILRSFLARSFPASLLRFHFFIDIVPIDPLSFRFLERFFFDLISFSHSFSLLFPFAFFLLNTGARPWPPFEGCALGLPFCVKRRRPSNSATCRVTHAFVLHFSLWVSDWETYV